MRCGVSRQILSFDGSFPLACRLPFCACSALLACCLPAVCAVPSCFGCLFVCSALFARAFSSYLLSFAFSCLAFAAQTSFHLSLRPRREFPCLSPPAALFPACGSCHLLLFRRLLRPLPVFSFCIVRAGFLSCFFALSCLTSSSQISFHLSLMPRRAPHFLFGKKMGEKNREGLRPFEPHSCALRPITPSSALLAGLTALRAANRRLAGKRLKSQRAELSFSSVSVRWGRAGAFPCPGKQELSAGTHPERTACVRGSNADTNTVRVLPTAGARACETRGRKRHGARLARRSRGLFPCLRKQEPSVGPAPGINRGRARRGEEKDTERDLLGAAAGFFPAWENRSRA